MIRPTRTSGLRPIHAVAVGAGAVVAVVVAFVVLSSLVSIIGFVVKLAVIVAIVGLVVKLVLRSGRKA